MNLATSDSFVLSELNRETSATATSAASVFMLPAAGAIASGTRAAGKERADADGADADGAGADCVGDGSSSGLDTSSFVD